MKTLKDRVLFITGASRGIGLAIAKRAARDGACVAIAAKSAEPHRHLPGTIYTAAEEIEDAGGRALPLVCDVRSPEQVQEAVEKTAETFGGIDICINNASAISLTGTLDTPVKSWDLMHQVNARGTFLVSRACIPFLKKAENPHVLTLSPPPDMRARWFSGHVAYTMAKYGMSLCVLGMAREFGNDGIAFNALWPRTTIATSAVRFALGGEKMMRASRTPDILADAARVILTKPSREWTGKFFIDDTLLYENGVRDFESYRIDPSVKLLPDFFVPREPPPPPGIGETISPEAYGMQ